VEKRNKRKQAQTTIPSGKEQKDNYPLNNAASNLRKHLLSWRVF